MGEGRPLEEAGEVHAQLIRVLAESAEIAERHGLPAEAAQALAGKLRAGAFEVMVVGAFKRGKSTLINALLGDEGLARCGLAAFRARLEAFLAQGRDEAQRQAARLGVLRFLGEVTRSLGLERQSLVLPIAELDDRLARFRAAAADLDRQRREAGFVLAAETKSLLQAVTDGLAALERDLAQLAARQLEVGDHP